MWINVHIHPGSDIYSENSKKSFKHSNIFQILTHMYVGILQICAYYHFMILHFYSNKIVMLVMVGRS